MGKVRYSVSELKEGSTIDFQLPDKINDAQRFQEFLQYLSAINYNHAVA
jgi:hypothetical protein